MLGSWFASKPEGNKTQDRPSRPSAELGPDGTNPFPSSTAHSPAAPVHSSTQDEPFPSPITAALSTPHDAVLAQLHGHRQEAAPTTEDGGVPDLPDHKHDAGGGRRGNNTHSNVVPPPSGDVTHEENLYDPFDGNSLGVLVPLNPPVHPEREKQVDDATNKKKEELWAHFSRVLELQNEIATMHVEMEGIRGRPGEGKGKGKGKGVGGRSAGDGKGAGVGSKDGGVADGDGDGEDEGVGVEPDEEAEKSKAREEEFATLAESFEGTKDSINDIMSKLDDLSKALTMFHSLQAPKIEFPGSRDNSLNLKSELPSKATTSRPTPFSSATLPSVIIPVTISHSEPTPTTTASFVASSPQLVTVESPLSTMHNISPPAA